MPLHRQEHQSYTNSHKFLPHTLTGIYTFHDKEETKEWDPPSQPQGWNLLTPSIIYTHNSSTKHPYQWCTHKHTHAHRCIYIFTYKVAIKITTYSNLRHKDKVYYFLAVHKDSHESLGQQLNLQLNLY